MAYEVLGGFLSMALFVLLILVVIMVFFSVRKTKQYRREVGDLYVAGKIRRIAKGDGIDLEEEKSAFMDWNKRRKIDENIDNYNYDDSVELELQDKITESIDNLKSKPKKEVTPKVDPKKGRK